jgi:hypothetical protein
MPIPLPEKPRSKAAAAEKPVDWLALWATSMGLASIALAAVAFFSIGDGIGAFFVLAGGAALIALAQYGIRPSKPTRP